MIMMHVSGRRTTAAVRALPTVFASLAAQRLDVTAQPVSEVCAQAVCTVVCVECGGAGCAQLHKNVKVRTTRAARLHDGCL